MVYEKRGNEGVQGGLSGNNSGAEPEITGRCQTCGCGKSSGNHQAQRDKGHDRAGKRGAYQKKRKGRLLLTESGREIAEKVYEKHCVITQLFSRCANVSEETAESDACKVEHVISEETFQGIKSYLNAMPKSVEN